LDKDQFFKIVETQPDETWMQGDYCDGEGHYCAVGWAMHTTGVGDDYMNDMELDAVALALGLTDGSKPQEFADMEDLLDMVAENNDAASSHAEAVEWIEGVLNG
jgi:hypothetical protein